MLMTVPGYLLAVDEILLYEVAYIVEGAEEVVDGHRHAVSVVL